MQKVRAKKFLGQHFLNDKQIAFQIVQALVQPNVNQTVLEVGPGMGVLTQYLLAEPTLTTWAVEVDTESVTYLMASFPQISERLITKSFLDINFNQFGSNQIAVIGNFPYNISSQIIFKIIDNYHQVPIMVGMFQKEVVERISAKPGGKDYGILTIITQAYFKVEYLFTVEPHVFTPPPKVRSAVIRLTKKDEIINCNEALFKKVVKTAFNQRRKKLRNALGIFNIADDILEPFTNLRAENLSVEDYVKLTNTIEANS